MSAGDAALSVSWRRSGRTKSVLIACALLLAAAGVASLAIGPVVIAPGNVISILWQGAFGAQAPVSSDLRDVVVVLDIRLPRTVMAALVGATLAVAGAVLQGVFRNPLADPGLVGISPGAALAAVAWIVFGGWIGGYVPALIANHALPLASFAGSLIAIVLLHRLATQDGRTSVANLLFAGIALGALANAGTGLFIFVASDQQLREFTFWTLGSLAGVGAAVAVSGIIGFVGLVVPHLLRLSIGPSHKSLFLGSALLGAALLTASDIFARTVASPAELPIGVVTAFIGAPFFIWLLQRHKRSFG